MRRPCKESGSVPGAALVRALPEKVQPGEGLGLAPLGQPLGLTSSTYSEAAGLDDGFLYPVSA